MHAQNVNLFDIELGIKIIREIKSKIGSLNAVSTKDFLLLNSIHKKYYHNISQIINLIDEINQQLEYNNETNTIYFLENRIRETEHVKELIQLKIEAFEKNINKLNEISLGGTYLDITTYAYKQSIIIFNLLSTNNLLNIVFEQYDKNSKLIKSWKNFNNHINIIKENCISLKKDLKEFNSTVESIKLYFEKNIFVFRKLVLFYETIIQKMKQQHNFISNYKKYSNQIKEKLKLSQKGASSNIINLQYQDILGQKLEHIQELLEEIDTELYTYKKHKISNKNSDLKNKYLHSISEIAKIQIKQLFNINNEYQTATMSIVQNLFKSSENVNSIQRYLIKKAFNQNNKTIKTSLTYINKTIDNEDNKNIFSYQFSDKLSGLENYFSGIIDKCTHLHNFSKDLINLSVEIVEMLKERSSKKDAQDESIEIIESELNRTQLGFSEIVNVQNQISKNCKMLTKNFTVVKDKNIFKQIDKNKKELSILTKSFNDSNNLFKTIRKISKPFINNNDFKIEKINYFTYYDNSIQSMITSFNRIVEILQNNLQTNEKSNSLNLDELKNKYTVSSEHNIHNQVTNKENIENKKDKTENDGIELF